MSDESIQKLGNFIKTWLPIVVTVGALVTGYFVFKSETRYQFELQKVELVSLREEVKILRKQIEDNRKDWQEGIEDEIRSLREDAIRRDFRIRSLENRSSASPTPSPSGSGFTPAPAEPSPEVTVP